MAKIRNRYNQAPHPYPYTFIYFQNRKRDTFLLSLMLFYGSKVRNDTPVPIIYEFNPLKTNGISIDLIQ